MINTLSKTITNSDISYSEYLAATITYEWHTEIKQIPELPI